MRILVVDADQSLRDSTANLLLACGVDSFEMASSIKEAREKVANVIFDMILVDLFLPSMAGLAFAIERRKLAPETKVILLIDDAQITSSSEDGPLNLIFPTILKSFVGRILPQLLFDELAN